MSNFEKRKGESSASRKMNRPKAIRVMKRRHEVSCLKQSYQTHLKYQIFQPHGIGAAGRKGLPWSLPVITREKVEGTYYGGQSQTKEKRQRKSVVGIPYFSFWRGPDAGSVRRSV